MSNKSKTCVWRWPKDRMDELTPWIWAAAASPNKSLHNNDRGAGAPLTKHWTGKYVHALAE